MMHLGYKKSNSTLLTGLVSYWKLDETSGNAADSVGSNTLTNTNVVTYLTGKINNGANFVSATSQKLTRTNILSGNNDITFAFWIKTSTASVSILGQYTSPVAGVWWIQVDATGKLIFLDYNGVSVFSATDTVTINDGNWHLCVVRINAALTSVDFSTDNSSFRNYTITSIGGSGLGTQDFSLGFHNGAYMNGMLDAVGYWQKLVSISEVGELWNSGNGIQHPF